MTADWDERAAYQRAVESAKNQIALLVRERDEARKAAAEFDRMRLLACQEVERLVPIAHKSRERQADLIFLRAECDGVKERLSRAEADAQALRTAVLAYVTSATYEERERLRAELYVLATVEHPGAMLTTAIKRLQHAWDALGRCSDEFEPADMSACGEYRDLLDTAILAVLATVKGTCDGL
jgi:hypothetical protein